MKSGIVTLCLIIIALTFSCTKVLGIKIEQIGKIDFPHEISTNPWSFQIMENGNFIISDFHAGKISIFKQEGNVLKFIQPIGRKGPKLNQYKNPAACFYDKCHGKFIVMDYGKGTIQFHYPDSRSTLAFSGVLDCPRRAYDMKLVDAENLLISGYIESKDGKNSDFDLYMVNLNELKDTNSMSTLEEMDVKLLLPSFRKYNLKSEGDFCEKFRANPMLRKLGRKGWFDVYDGFAFYVWESNLNILKIDLRNGEITPFISKQESGYTQYYTRPSPSQELSDAYDSGVGENILRVKSKMSFIKDLFVTPNYVMVIYTGAADANSDSLYRLQFYNHNGLFLDDLPIPGTPSWRFYLDKDKNILYSIDTDNTSILKYQITDR